MLYLDSDIYFLNNKYIFSFEAKIFHKEIIRL